MSNGGDETQAGGGDETRAGGTPREAPEGEDGNRRLLFIVLGVVLAGAVIGAGIAVALGGDDNAKEAGGTSTSESTSTSTSTAAATTPSGGGGGGGGGGTTTTAPSNAPTINLSASKGTSPTCSPDIMNFDSPTDPLDFTISWSTTNATHTVLSVDSPGEYSSSGASGSSDFNYGCSDQSHTFTVTATGPNGQTQKAITVSINAGP